MLIGMNSTLHSTNLPNLKKFGQLATQKIQITCLRFLRRNQPPVARVCPSSNSSELSTIGTCPPSFTKIVRKLWTLSCRQTDRQADRRTDGRWRAYRRKAIS